MFQHDMIIKSMVRVDFVIIKENNAKEIKLINVRQKLKPKHMYVGVYNKYSLLRLWFRYGRFIIILEMSRKRSCVIVFNVTGVNYFRRS